MGFVSMVAELPGRTAAFLSTPRGMGVFLYCLCFGALGLCLSTLGPVLLDLAVQTTSTLTYTGYCFGVRSLGYALGSAGGFLYDRFPGHLVLGSAMLLAALGTLAVPHVRSVFALGAAVCLQGIGMGFCDTGGNVMTIWWFGADVGPAMQSLHFAFALGATLGPLLLRAVEVPVVDQATGQPMLGQGSYNRAFYLTALVCAIIGLALFGRASPKPRSGHGVAGSTGDASPAEGASASTAAPPLPVDPTAIALALVTGPGAAADGAVATSKEGEAADPWAAAGMPAGPSKLSSDAAAASSAGVAGSSASDPWAAQPLSPPLPGMPGFSADGSSGSKASGASGSIAEAAGTAGGSAAGESSQAAPPPAVPAHLSGPVWKLVGLVASMLFLYVGAETGYGAYLTPYAVLALGTSEAEGQLLSGWYWAGIMVGRFASIFTASMMTPERLLSLAMAGSAASSLLLLIFGKVRTMVWVLTAAFGASMACIFPTAMALAEGFFPVQGVHATAFVVGAAAGEMLIPFIIATLFGGTVPTELPADGTASGGAAAGGEPGPGGGGIPGVPVVGPQVMLWAVAITCIAQFAAFQVVMKYGKKVHNQLQQAQQVA